MLGNLPKRRIDFFLSLLVASEIAHSSSSTSITLRQCVIHVANNVSTQKFLHTHKRACTYLTHAHQKGKNIHSTSFANDAIAPICASLAPKWVRARRSTRTRASMRTFFICLTRAELGSCTNTGWKETHKASASDQSRPSAVQLCTRMWCFVLLLNLCEPFYLLWKLSSYSSYIHTELRVRVFECELDERLKSVGFCTSSELRTEFSWKEKNQDHAVCFDHDHRTGHT